MELLPQLRAMLAKNLLDSNMSQVKVAEVLGVTQGAVSQYTHSIRGAQNPIVKNEVVKKRMNDLSKEVLAGAGQEKIMLRFCDVCKEVRRKGILCKRHKEAYSSLKDCDICLKK